ncbi:MAG: hypothetical protein NE334_01060 [Lentisphaeraceae bacterium]|nr:hypothetical protein [Lentisphaeraceae bacterium]
MTWNFQKPKKHDSTDQAVSLKSTALKGKNVCLGICGSIAAYKAPDIIRELRKHGATVTAFASPAALNFVTEMALEWTSTNKPVTSLSADAEHLGGDKSFDIYLYAPASYSSINKMATGIADTPVTISFSSALGQLEEQSCKVFVAPCMHGTMHNTILNESMKKLAQLGVSFMQPRQEDGKNKLPEPDEIVENIIQSLK